MTATNPLPRELVREHLGVDVGDRRQCHDAAPWITGSARNGDTPNLQQNNSHRLSQQVDP